jgi:hypothetical protein
MYNERLDFVNWYLPGAYADKIDPTAVLFTNETLWIHDLWELQVPHINPQGVITWCMKNVWVAVSAARNMRKSLCRGSGG